MTFYFGETSTEIEYLNLSSGLPLNLTQLLCLLQLQFPYLLTGNSKKTCPTISQDCCKHQIR